MAFYIITNGNLRVIELDYLQTPSGKRLEKTVVPGAVKVLNECEVDAQRTYAIEVMTKPVITVPFDAMASEALDTFEEAKIHHLVLTEGDEVKGLLSTKDLSFLTSLELEEHAMARQFMSSMILVCDEDTPIDHLAKVMVREGISAIPVVDKEKFLAGIVTHHDLLQWIFE